MPGANPSARGADYWISGLGLEPHPEGGYYRETYRSESEIGACCLPGFEGGSRSVSTGIYYLLAGSDFSAFHRIRSDEIWHHYAGARLRIHMFDGAGRYHAGILDRNLADGARPQVVVPAGAWFAAAVDDVSAYALVGCTVAPGFDFRDFEIAKREELLERFPSHRRLIEALTRT